jgi:hypothetical protein
MFSGRQVSSSKVHNRHRYRISLGLIQTQLLPHSSTSGFMQSSNDSYGNSLARFMVERGR